MVKVIVFIEKLENIHFDNISNNIQSYETLSKGSLNRDLQIDVTLGGQGHNLLKSQKISNCDTFFFYNISDTFYSRVMKLGQQVACRETFKMMWHWVTLTKSQGHSLFLKVKKYSSVWPFLTIFQTLFFGNSNMKVGLWGDFLKLFDIGLP